MEAGILFYLSRRTSVCQKMIAKTIGWFEMQIGSVRACTEKNRINGSMACLLREYPVVFLVSAVQGGRPACAGHIFNTLKVPPDRNGEPRGVKKLPGRECTGYLVESVNQAILLLPDDPSEMLEMLPAACGRLKQKFDLTGEIPPVYRPDFEKIIKESLGGRMEPADAARPSDT